MNPTLEKKFTGAIERKETEQDVLLGSFASTSTRPAVYMPDFLGKVEDQKQTPSCGAHAGQSLKQILANFEGSPEYLWKKIKLIDGFPAEAGTDLLSIVKTLNKKGITPISLMPNHSEIPLDQYTDPSTITPEMDVEAAKHKVGPYAFTWSPSFEQLKQNIYDHKAVIMLLRVGAEWWRDKNNQFSTWQEKDILPLRTNIPVTSGHFVTAFAYDEQYVYFVNEWSDQWGRKGIGYFDINYMARCVEIGTTVNLETTKYAFIKTLKKGMKGYDVGQLQKRLNEILGQDLTVDNDFGINTFNAVERFQASRNIHVDGVVGSQTNAELNR